MKNAERTSWPPSTFDFSRMLEALDGERSRASVTFFGSSNARLASAILGLLAMVWSSSREPT